MMKKTLSFPFNFMIGAAAISLLAASFPHSTLLNAATEEIAVDFRTLAKNAIPGVVSVQVTGKKSSPFGARGNDLGDSDLFGDDFWKFFSIPRREGQQSPLVGQASGFLVSADGYILTNSHVVNGADKITVQLNDGREFSAKLAGEDPNSDVALIKIDGKDLPFLKLSDSDTLEVGEWVAAIGNPLGLQATLTHGVVSAKGRNNLDISRFEDYIQTDAAIYKGNSGGPLLNLKGEVVGINTAIATNSTAGYLGIGFAIPSNIARHVMENVLADGKVSRGFIGVTMQSIDQNLANAFGLLKAEGALVTTIQKGSPADKAGIRVEDIIIKADSRTIDSPAALRNSIYMMKPGAKTVLTVIRNGQTLQIPLEIAAFEESAAIATGKPNNLGVEVETLTPETAQKLGYGNDSGVIISKINPGSVAAFAGLKKGALIIAVNRKAVENPQQFEAVLSEAAKDKPVLLQIKQGGQMVYISLKTE